jgi:hypothetical protein
VPFSTSACFNGRCSRTSSYSTPREPVSTAPADARMRLRHYLPYPISDTEQDAFQQLGARYEPETPTSAAARWYLRAAQAGPVADSIVYLWIAIDALLGTEGDRVVPALRDRFNDLGIDLTPLPLSIGRLYGLRGEVVHKGLEEPLISVRATTCSRPWHERCCEQRLALNRCGHFRWDSPGRRSRTWRRSKPRGSVPRSDCVTVACPDSRGTSRSAQVDASRRITLGDGRLSLCARVAQATPADGSRLLAAVNPEAP